VRLSTYKKICVSILVYILTYLKLIKIGRGYLVVSSEVQLSISSFDYNIALTFKETFLSIYY